MTRHQQLTLRVALSLGVLCASGCSPASDRLRQPRSTLVVGIDVSGSFRAAGHYADAIEFAANYLYGRLNGLGGLRAPSAVFVGSVGGTHPGETKSFQPAHAFRGRSVEQISALLREQFPPDDRYTDFNAFFDRTATLVKRHGLALTPIDVVILSDGVPDVTPGDFRRDSTYTRIDMAPLEYISRSVTVRLLYGEPTVSVDWERLVPRRRIRMWTVDAQVMQGWREQRQVGVEPESQHQLWSWIRDNVDFRVRSRRL